jgi:hypothetical protein
VAVSGVVDHDVEPPEALVRPPDGGEGRGAVGDVERERPAYRSVQFGWEL